MKTKRNFGDVSKALFFFDRSFSNTVFLSLIHTEQHIAMADAPAKKSRLIDYGGKTETYAWDQEHDAVTITFKPFSAETTKRDLTIEFTKTTIFVARSGTVLIGTEDGRPIKLGGPIKDDECTWLFPVDTKELTIELFKHKDKLGWWASLVEGGEQIDMDLIEGSKYLDDSLLQKIKDRKKNPPPAEAASSEQ